MYWSVILILTILFVGTKNEMTQSQAQPQVMPILLTANKSLLIQLPPLAKAQFQLSHIPSSVRYVVFQAHTQDTILNVSFTQQWGATVSTQGRHIGLLTLLKPADVHATWYLNSTGHVAVNTLVAAITYENNVPVAGACNLEFPMENDPNIYLNTGHLVNVIQYAYANQPFERGVPPPSCENQEQQLELYYDIYAHFLSGGNLQESHLYEALQGLLTYEGIKKNSTKVMTQKYSSGQTRLNFAGYPSQGVIYSVIVKLKVKDLPVGSAAYVSTATYSCNLNPNSANHCTGKKSSATQVVTTILAIAGLLICFFGHRFFRCEMFFFGFLALGLITYVLVARFSGLNFPGELALVIFIGLIGGSLWTVFWCIMGIPILSVLLAGLVCGVLFSSVLLDCTPLGEMKPFKNSFTYGMTFACGVLIPSVGLLAFTRKLSIISCTFVGSFNVIVALHSFIPSSSLGYFMVNSFHKMTIPGYIQVINIVPFKTPDKLLCVFWVLLTVAGTVFQWYREHNRPDFPPCPYAEYKMRQARQLQTLLPHSQICNDAEEVNERSPLFRGPGPALKDEPIVQPL